MINHLGRILILVCTAYFVGCTNTISTPAQNETAKYKSPSGEMASLGSKEIVSNFVESKDRIVGYHENRPPLQLQILGESNDGVLLQIKVRVTPLVDWPTEKVVVLLSALQNGVVISESAHCITGICGESNHLNAPALEKSVSESTILKRNAPIDLTLTVPSQAMTDYVVDLLWGEEAGNFRSKLPGVSAPMDLQLPELVDFKVGDRLSSCEKSICSASYGLTATLVNKSPAILKSITLGAGFILDEKASNDRDYSKIPEKEDEIPLPELYLSANSSKTIEIVLEQSVPREMLARIVPSLRILSHEYKSE